MRQIKPRFITTISKKYFWLEAEFCAERRTLNIFPDTWKGALTVIHELSHIKQRTDDIHYNFEGLKPNAAFSEQDAINNAESWAYFAADMVGILTDAERREAGH